MTAGRRASRHGPSTGAWWRGALLNVGAVVGLVCILAAIGAGLFGLRPLVFRSGSMEPSIATGALAVSRSVPVDDVKVGDIVSVLDSQGVRITHRVYSVDPQGAKAVLTLKGDANEATDAETYTVSSVDRVMFDVPLAGYAVSFLGGPVGVFAGGALVMGLGFIAFRPRRGGEVRGGARKAGAVVLVVGLGLGLASGPGPTSTLASFTDTSRVTTGSFKALTVPPPTGATCTGAAVINWTTAGANYSYQVVVRKTSDNSVLRTDTTTSTSYTVMAGLLGNLESTNLTVTVKSFPTGVATWLSSGSTSTLARLRLLGLGATCGNI